MDEVFVQGKLPQVANKVLKKLRPGDVLALEGPLAAGKTSLTQAILKLMGYEGKVSSPTFVLEKHYPVDYKDIKEVIHLDFYRLTKNKLGSFGWRDYLGQPHTLTIIEWPEVAQAHLPSSVKRITLEIVDEHTRRLTFFDNPRH